MRGAMITAGVGLLLAVTATEGQTQIPPDWDPVDERNRPTNWQYGPRWSLDEPIIWNPIMEKIQNGEPIIGATIRGTDPRIYCAVAASGYDFTWVEMQHEAITHEQMARMWAQCPGPAVPGVRIAHESEGNLQMPADMGALFIAVPTIDTVEEAQRAVDFVYHPPMGRRSSGGGQGPGQLWGSVPGGFRATWNDNVVLILMIETLMGVKNAREIARIPGVDGLFAAAGDLGNFSGYGEGDPEYEMLITEIEEAALEAGKILCGPLRWMGVRENYTCFQASSEAGLIRSGAQSQLASANQRWNAMIAGVDPDHESDLAQLLMEISGQCGSLVYEADCYDAVEQAVGAAEGMTGADREALANRLSEVVENTPALGSRIRDIAQSGGLTLD